MSMIPEPAGRSGGWADVRVMAYAYDAGIAASFIYDRHPAQQSGAPETATCVYDGFGTDQPSGLALPASRTEGDRYPLTAYPTATVSTQKFTGKERDAETGLDFFGARYFRSAQGRFTSVDPAFESEYLPYPQSWNRYAYVYNRPLSLTDPDGRCPQCLPALGVGLIGGAISAGITLATGGNLRDAEASFAGGFVASGLPVLTLGTSLVPELTVGAMLEIGGVSAGSNIVGGAISRGFDSDPSTAPFDPTEVAIDGTVGFGFGNLGNVAGLLTSDIAAPPRPRIGPLLKEGVRAAAEASKKYKSAVQRAARAGRSVGIGVGLGSGLVSFLRFLFVDPPPPPAPQPPKPPSGVDSVFTPCVVGGACG